MEGVLAGPGTVLAGRYTLERELGRGGMATVFLASDQRHNRAVAVKILRPELSVCLGSQRFLREIGIAAHLTHPNILPLHDSGESGDLLYYVMPYVDGESLRERLLREGPLPVEHALRITREVADALGYAHAHGVVHRDIKPANILLEAGHAVVADFGVARALSSVDELDLTSSGLIVGTPVYMSPEQVSGSPVDGRSDLYSLGCVLYEMLTGSPPFTGPNQQAIAAMQVRERPLSLEAVLPSAPRAVVRALDRVLEKNPDDRFPDASQFVDALSGVVTTPLPTGIRRGVKRRLGALLCLVALVGGAVWRYSAVPGTLDSNRILILPIQRSTTATNRTVEDATLALIASLNSTSSLVGIDGGKLAAGIEPTAAAAARLARSQGAAFYVEGRLLASDSLRLLLGLNDVQARSVSHRVLSFPPESNGWTVGVRAALELLPSLIPTGRQPELPSLAGRSPAALGEYFLGERDYRRAAFSSALEHFQRALAADSGFALAALRGAQAASWDVRGGDAEALVGVALAHEKTLPLRQQVFARGLQAWLTGKADSAMLRFNRAIELDPTAAEPWMGLAETYNHLIPQAAPLDSLAEAAYLQVHELDSTFAPVLLHLIEFAVRRGDRDRAAMLVAKYPQVAGDPHAFGSVQLMLGCVLDTMSTEAWRSAVHRSPAQVSAAAQTLALGGLRQPACARAAWEAILYSDTSSGSMRSAHRFGALLGLHGLLVAQGHDDQVRALLEGDTLSNPSYRGQLYILGALAGASVDKEADTFAERGLRLYRTGRANLKNIELWFLGIWLAHRGRAAEAEELADVIQRRAVQDDPRRDSLLAAGLRARATLAAGDSLEALRQLRAMVPTARSHQDLTWSPWESLAGERILLGQLLLARNEVGEALQVAINFDSPVPIAYLMYLPASLSLRIQAAERLGDIRLAQLSRARLAALRADHRREASH